MSLHVAGVPRVRADLRLVVDGVGAHIQGDGRQLVVRTSDAPALLAKVVDTPNGGIAGVRQSVSKLARALDEAGLSLVVTEPRGQLVEIGAGCHSRLGQLVLGSQHAQLGKWGAVTRMAAGYVRTSSAVRDWSYRAAGGLAIAAILIATSKTSALPVNRGYLPASGRPRLV